MLEPDPLSVARATGNQMKVSVHNFLARSASIRKHEVCVSHFWTEGRQKSLRKMNHLMRFFCGKIGKSSAMAIRHNQGVARIDRMNIEKDCTELILVQNRRLSASFCDPTEDAVIQSGPRWVVNLLQLYTSR
jgi:hypothetical protein